MNEVTRTHVRQACWDFMRAMRSLQNEGHDVDSVLSMLEENMKDLGMDGSILTEVSRMKGGHKREAKGAHSS